MLRAAVLAGGLLWAATAALAWTHDSGDKDNEWEGDWAGCCNWRDFTSCAYTGRASNWTQSDWQFRGRFQVRVHLDGCCNYQHGGNCPYYIQRSGGGTVFTPWKNQCNENGAWRDLHTANWNGDSDRFWRLRLYAWDCAYPNCSTWNEAGAGAAHFYGEKWDYINDWVCLGGYSGTIGDNATGWTESDIYLYPAVDTSHGNVFNYGGKVPGRVQTGDCNWANKLDWKGNAASYGNCDYCYSYGFAWMYAPSGAGPKFLIGADDDQKTYVNGTQISSGTQCCNRDNFETGGISMPAGWSRILFKVRNGSGGFNGTVSLRSGGDRGWNEGSVTRYSGSYGLGYEQDDWYPRIDVANFYGGSNPQPNANYYGNNTTVTANGTASVTGPVPFWKVMHYEWGYGISEGNYADVSSSGTSWSHTQSGVTGHRRFHFFSVSKSKRCSFQNNGASGGWNWGDGGPGNYMDVYVDNVAPQNPSFSSVTTVSTSQINLAWAIPLDQGVGIVAGATEAADETSAASSNHYRRGDVGVQVYRNASAIYTWGVGTSKNDLGLTANTAYTYTIEARDNTGQSRGAWANTTGQKDSRVVWTLSAAPTAGTVTAAAVTYGDEVSWTAVNGFGAGKVQYYRYAFDQNATKTSWTDTETQWSSGELEVTPTAAGTWYLHIKGYNGAHVGNGNYDYAVTVNKKSVTGTFTAANKVYDGTPTATVLTRGLNGLVFSDVVTLDGGAANFADRHVGTGKTVTLSGASLGGAKAGNYELGSVGTTTANITAKALTVTGLTASAKVYDGTTDATLGGTAAFQETELPGAGSTDDGKPYTVDSIAIGGSAAGAFADRHVGTAKSVTVSGVTVTGNHRGNYTVTQPTGLTANITAKALTVTGLTAGSKVYDATTAVSLSGTAALLGAEAPGTGTTSDGKPYTGDTVSVGGGAAGSVGDRNVGSNKAVTVTGCTLSGAQAGNYTVTQPTGLTANITAKALTITGLSAVNKFYDGTTAVTLNGTAALLAAEGPGSGSTEDGKPYMGDDVSAGGTAAGEFADRNVGTDIAVNISGVSLSGAQSGNYTANLAVKGDILDTKTDASTTTIVDANSANFGLTLNAGTLLANASESINGTGTVTVNSGATLGGSGKAGTAVVNSGGTLAPGAGAGVLGTLTLGAAPSLGGTVAMKIKKTSGPVYAADKLSLSAGELSYGGTLTVTELGGGEPLAGGDVFALFDAAGGFDAGSSFSTINLPALPTPPQGEPAVNWYTGNLTVDGTIIVNRAPEGVQDHVLTRAPGTSMKINIATLRTMVMAGVEDLDSGDAASYDTLASFTSNRGTVVTESGGRYLYAPNHNCNDYLEYRVKDQRGGAVTAKIRILVEPYYGKVELRHDGGGTVSLLFYGIPGYDYYIQRKCTVEGTWADLYGPLTCTAAGLVTHDDTPGGCNPAFYRLRTAGEVCQ